MEGDTCSMFGADNYLPDLGNEKDSDQILFEQKVFRANEKFIEVNEALIRCFKSPEDKQECPKVANRNRNAYKSKAKNYIYDERKGIHIVQESDKQ